MHHFYVITRCVGVFFGYMAVEGFNYTRNVYRYGCLYIWEQSCLLEIRF